MPKKSPILIKGSEQFFIYSREPRSRFFFLSQRSLSKNHEGNQRQSCKATCCCSGASTRFKMYCWNTSSTKNIRGRCWWPYSLSPESWFWSKGTSTVRLKQRTNGLFGRWSYFIIRKVTDRSNGRSQGLDTEGIACHLCGATSNVCQVAVVLLQTCNNTLTL